MLWIELEGLYASWTISCMVTLSWVNKLTRKSKTLGSISTIIDWFDTKFIILTDICILIVMISFLITIVLSNPKILTLLELFRHKFLLMIKIRGLIDDQLSMFLINFAWYLFFYHHFWHFMARFGWIRIFLH